jgi:hypothetical protein
MANWTTADDVVASWIGDDAPADMQKIEAWIGKAERLLRSKLPDLYGRVQSDPVTEPDLLSNVRDVVVTMVQRVFRNPEGVRTRQESTGPFGGSVTYGGDQPGALWATDAELAMLTVAGSSRGAFTIDMIPSTSPFSDSYVPPIGGW